MATSTHKRATSELPPQARPRQESQDLLRQITDTATSLFRQKGFHGTSTQEIADAVGLVKATLFYHIGSKEDLLYRIGYELAEASIARWRGVVEAHANSSPTEVARALIVEHVRMVDEQRDGIAVVNDEMRYLTADRLAVISGQWREYRRILDDVVADGVARQEFRGLDEHRVTLAIVTMLNNFYNWYEPGGRLSATEVGSVAATLVLNGLTQDA